MNIGFACSLLRTDMALYRVSAETPEVARLEDAGRAAEVCASSVTTLHILQTYSVVDAPCTSFDTACACTWLLPTSHGRGGHSAHACGACGGLPDSQGVLFQSGAHALQGAGAILRVSSRRTVPWTLEIVTCTYNGQAAVLAAAAVREQLADALLGIEAAREAASGAEDGGGDSALVIDGRALAHALGPDMRQTLLAVRAQTLLVVRAAGSEPG